MERLSKIGQMLKLTDVWSERATCDRLHVGSVIVNGDAQVSAGYNGAPRNLDHCDDVGHMVEDNHCKRVLHAEVNAIINAARVGVSTLGATLYCNYQPCWECFKAIINAGIKKVVYRSVYKTEDIRVVQAAARVGIILEKYTEHERHE